jgi:HlyD family secretion protein
MRLFAAWSRRTLAGLALAAAVAGGIVVWQLQIDETAAKSLPTVTATRDDIVVSVGGVGRVVHARGSAEIAVPTALGGAAVPAGGGSAAPADAVFARTSGRLSGFLVAPGQRVAPGRPLALLDDGGVAAAVVKQAENDLATAMLELRQKRTSDPLTGFPPTPAELAAGRLAVTSARERLARLQGPPRPADVSAARLDVRRAEADLEALLGGTPEALAEAIRLAEVNVQLAQERLDRILAPPSPAEIAAADAEVKKAESDLAVLLRPPPGPLPEAVRAAERAINAARQRLADAQAAGDLAEMNAAQLELDKALAELATLQRAPPGPLPEEVASARAAVDAARAKRAKLLEPPNPADVTAARLELERAQAELRARLAGPNPAALTAARQAVDSARARLAQLLGPPLRSDIAGARLDIGRAEAELAVLRARGRPGSRFDIGLARLKVRAARARLASARFAGGLLTVRAPSGGTVTALLTVRGAPVDATTPIVAVADLDRLAVSVDLSEFDVARVRPGLRAVVSVDALGGKAFPGKVLFAALSGTGTGGVVTFPVRVGLRRVGGLRSGMNVSVRIIVALRRDVVQVPLEAVSRDDNERQIVTVIDDTGRTSPRRVTLGLANNKSVEIVKGLRPGEQVVLSDGQGEEDGSA